MKKILWTFAILTLSSLSFGQMTQPGSGAGRAAVTQIRPQGPFSSADCAFTFTEGAVINFLKFCVTATGNMTVFETPKGHEHIAVGVDGEGYGICDLQDNVAYFDFAEFGNSTNWGAPSVVSQTTKSVQIARTTLNGIWTLTQTFTRMGGNRPSVKIAMNLRNNSVVDRDAFLLRYADVDADGNTSNNLDGTLNSAFAWNPESSDNGPGLGVILENLDTANMFSFGFAQGVAQPPDPCNSTSQLAKDTLIGADGSLVMDFFGTVHKLGRSVTATVSYKGM
jgi:hypothetical protein